MDKTASPFSGKVALVTGGGTGIGRATAERIASLGGQVVIAGRREEPLRNVVSRHPSAISHVVMDQGERDSQTRALDAVRQRHGRLDILVNNAAIQTTKLFIDHEEDEIARLIHVNLTSTTILIHKALPLLIASKGNIVNVTSAGGRYCGVPSGQISVYSASKAGLNHLTRVLASELGAHGVRVNAVAPGLTDTEIAAEAFANDATLAYCKSITALGRAGTPDEVARAICFMASEDGGWVTGQVLDASGGFWLTA
jgi:NAD(P)-dependent dehydrogenase (short-subunit alcohol dehydrogenase family)